MLLEKLFPEGEQGVCDGGHRATLGRLDVLPEGLGPQRAMCPCSHLVLPGEWADAGLWPAPRGLPQGSAELGSKPSGLQALLRVPQPDRGSVSPAYPFS